MIALQLPLGQQILGAVAGFEKTCVSRNRGNIATEVAQGWSTAMSLLTDTTYLSI